MTTPERAISVMQPWAWLIVHGWKDVENRTWSHSHRGPTLVHAGLKVDQGAHEALCDGVHPVTGMPAPELSRAYTEALIAGHVYKGGFVGQVDIVDCVDTSDSPWFVGPKGFTLANHRPDTFRPSKGALGFYRVRPTA